MSLPTTPSPPASPSTPSPSQPQRATTARISPSGAVAVNYGTDQAFTITPNTGYHVADVLVDGVSVGAVTSYTFKMSQPTTPSPPPSPSTPTPSPPQRAPTARISPSGAVSVDYGTDQAFTITPSTGYHVADVLVDGVSVGAVTSYTFTDVDCRPHHRRQLRHQHLHHHRLSGR